MGRAIEQFYIPDRQLQASTSPPNVNVWTDIGEAKIQQTIFGKAKIQIIRKQDKKRRAWLWTILVVTASVAASWQGWEIYQLRLNAAPPPSLSQGIKMSPPVFQSVNSPLVAAPSAPPNKLLLPSLLAPNSLPASLAKDSSLDKNISPTKNTSPAKNQVYMPQPPKLAVPTQVETPTIPSLTAVNSESKNPKIVTPLAEPLIKRDPPNPQP